MKSPTSFLSAIVIGRLLVSLTSCTKQANAEDETVPTPPATAAAKTAAGHWEGEVTLPGTTLGIRVDLEQGGDAWKGTIDIPVQGLRGFALGDVIVDGANISFKMPNIPGDPVFQGMLSPESQSIAGNLSQSGQTFPFKMDRAVAKTEHGETPGRPRTFSG